MLSRTAENIFWMARYIERAESTARLIQMGQRMAILPGPIHREEWRDMWEALNEDWRRLEHYDVSSARRNLPELIDWVKTRAATFRGAVDTGQLRNEGHDFLRIGGALERTEMTLRLLDVKYYVLLPETAVIGGARDHYQWTSVLHALSASRVYHHVYGGGDYSPWKIADLLVLNPQFPRSVSFCFRQIGWHLDRLAEAHGGQNAAYDTARAMLADLRTHESGEIFEEGLHEFVQNALVITNRLSREIALAYHFN